MSPLTNYCLDRCNYLLKNTDNPLEYLAIRTVFGVKTEIRGTNVTGTQHDSLQMEYSSSETQFTDTVVQFYSLKA